jgi:hypothetical protein
MCTILEFGTLQNLLYDLSAMLFRLWLRFVLSDLFKKTKEIELCLPALLEHIKELATVKVEKRCCYHPKTPWEEGKSPS